MISFAAPIHAGPQALSPPSHESSPTTARSRRFAILPPPPDPPPPPPLSSPPLPARSPLRLTPRTPPSAPAAPPDSAPSKRTHALIELLSSERAYASDLALIRDIHIPLALGQPSPFLAASSAATPPPPPPPVPPMTREDAKIVFGNVGDLAVFSEVFCDKLEEALGGVLDPDGAGTDGVAERVADLFLAMIPHMKPPYTAYITRHPSAVAHLNALPQTPGLTAYLAQTHTLAQSYTHAWDLPSLLIKPVQRLLKYPLLLSAVMEDTAPGAAKDRLRDARDKVEEVARGVNEGRRRWDVVKTLLDGKHPPPVRLKSMRVLKQRHAGKDGQSQLETLEKRVHACAAFVQTFAKDIVDWSMSVRDFIAHLERWSTTFGRVIALGQPTHGSEALDLFIDIVTSQISPIWISLDTAIQTTLLPKLARLLATTGQPLLLLEHMHALRPQHVQLLETPMSKTRPPNALVEASQSYLALEAQLRTELPSYIQILERGLTACVGQLSDWQARFWKEVRAQWVELWDALSIEGDMTAGAADTVKVWWERWEEIDAAAARLGITTPRRDRSSRTSQTTGPAAALATSFVAGPKPTSPTMPRPRRHSIQSIDLEIDTRLGLRGSPLHDAVVASPDSYSSFGVSSKRGGSSLSASPQDRPPHHSADAIALARRESERVPFGRKDNARQMAARHHSTRLPVVRVDGERPLTTRPEISLPSTARLSAMRATSPRQDAEWSARHPGISKKTSVDSTASSMHRVQQQSSSSSPRVSIHTTSESVSSSASNRRLSMQSMDVHIGMDVHALPGQRPPSSTREGEHVSPASLPPGASPGAPPGASPGAPPGASPGAATPGALTPSKKPSPVRSGGEDGDARGRPRVLKKPSIRKRFADAFRSPSKRPATAGAGGRVGGGTFTVLENPAVVSAPVSPVSPVSFTPAASAFASTHAPPAPASAPAPPMAEPEPETIGGVYEQPRAVMYTCVAVHPFRFPEGERLPLYRGLPFVALEVGDTVGVLAEEGHPCEHAELPIRPVDEGEEGGEGEGEGRRREDCLLVVRDEGGRVGWALASFLVILS